MQYTRYRYSGYASNRFPLGVKWLLIGNTALYLLYFFAVRTGFDEPFQMLGLSPVAVLRHGALWQLVTYMFLHDPVGFFHILFNMLTLWMFGADLERDWGTKPFLQYYFLCGVGAGLCDVAANALAGSWFTRTIGASGAIYGLLLAYGVMYPNRTVLFNFLFPMPAKYFVLILGVIAFLSSMSVSGSGISHVAHLGGMVFGYLYLKRRGLNPANLFGRLRNGYRDWKLQRARRKFQVYMRKQNSNRDRWVN